ncbi:MAG: HAD family phosphatase [Bacteroidales bacterium]|nr:HAD family phosphatase [Bacteroidales bacterium]
MIKAVFFDMDGVLYDSMPAHEIAWCETFRRIGMAFSPTEAYENEGRTATGTINIVFERSIGRKATDKEVEDLYVIKTQLMRECGPAKPFPAMKRLLPELRRRGVSVFIVTGSRQPSLVDKLTAEFGVDSAHLITGRDVKYGKPNPEPYLMALERSGERPEDCLVVENAPLGVESGKAAGLPVLAVNTGKLSDSYLSAADKLFHTTEEVESYLLQTI